MTQPKNFGSLPDILTVYAQEVRQALILYHILAPFKLPLSFFSWFLSQSEEWHFPYTHIWDKYKLWWLDETYITFMVYGFDRSVSCWGWPPQLQRMRSINFILKAAILTTCFFTYDNRAWYERSCLDSSFFPVLSKWLWCFKERFFEF